MDNNIYEKHIEDIFNKIESKISLPKNLNISSDFKLNSGGIQALYQLEDQGKTWTFIKEK